MKAADRFTSGKGSLATNRYLVEIRKLGREVVDFSKTNSWLQIAANLGIVVGLLLVGIQLKQNSDLLKIQLLYQESDRAMQLEALLVGENGAEVWAKSIEDPEHLTLAEQRIMEALLWSYTEQLRSLRRLAELGLLDSTDWRLRVKTEAGFFYGSRYGTAWWKNFSGDDGLLPKDLVDAVDEHLSQYSTNYTLEYIKGPTKLLNQSIPKNDATSQ